MEIMSKITDKFCLPSFAFHITSQILRYGYNLDRQLGAKCAPTYFFSLTFLQMIFWVTFINQNYDFNKVQ